MSAAMYADSDVALLTPNTALKKPLGLGASAPAHRLSLVDSVFETFQL